MRRAERGFSLIELLVVMIIIGILAAIAIPVFLNQRQKARDTAVKSDVAVVGKGIVAHWTSATTAPTITVSGGNVLVAGDSVGRLSTDVLLLDYATPQAAVTSSLTTTGMTQNAWCVNMRDGRNASAGVYKFSAQAGLGTGRCTNATTP